MHNNHNKDSCNKTDFITNNVKNFQVKKHDSHSFNLTKLILIYGSKTVDKSVVNKRLTSCVALSSQM